MHRGLVRLEQHNDGEFANITRVFRVLAGIHGDTLRKIETVEDHKGCLCVLWLADPDVGDMARVESAWVNEHEHMLEYTLPDGSQLDVSAGTTVRTPARTS